MELYRIVKNVSYCDCENDIEKPENSGFWGVMDGGLNGFQNGLKGVNRDENWFKVK